MVALPSFVVGSVALGMVLIGVVPATAVGASMPIIIAAAAGMFVATIWAARIGQNASAGITGVFGSFFLSYALLVLGLIHNWYGIAPTAVADTQKMFVISWIAIVTMLVLISVRLPMIYGFLFVLIDVSLVLNLLGIIQNSTNLARAAGWVLMAVAATIVYLFLGAASHDTGGKELPLGPPILHA
jgi:succinate-acetate transporter protein